MNFSTIFLVVLYITLIYLHISRSPLILHNDIKVARTLALILLMLLGLKNVVIIPNPLILAEHIIYGIASWVLMVMIYYKILAGCCKIVEDKSDAEKKAVE